jgi:serine/threonine protein kinase
LSASSDQSPNTCTVHEIGEFEGSPYIAMELKEGTLKHKITGKQLALNTLLEWPLRSRLDAAHAQGIVHRDLNPANVFVMSRRQAKDSYGRKALPIQRIAASRRVIRIDTASRLGRGSCLPQKRHAATGLRTISAPELTSSLESFASTEDKLE